MRRIIIFLRQYAIRIFLLMAVCGLFWAFFPKPGLNRKMSTEPSPTKVVPTEGPNVTSTTFTVGEETSEVTLEYLENKHLHKNAKKLPTEDEKESPVPRSTPFLTQNTVAREEIRKDIEKTLHEALKLDKGTGCELPKLTPYSEEWTWYDRIVPRKNCSEEAEDWVECYGPFCRVTKEIKEKFDEVECSYRDIIFFNDYKVKYGEVTRLPYKVAYNLLESDYVHVTCDGKNKTSNSILCQGCFLGSKVYCYVHEAKTVSYGERVGGAFWDLICVPGYAGPLKSKQKVTWTGNVLGFRPMPPMDLTNLNVVILCIDSLSRSTFTRFMRKSYKVLTKELDAVLMDGFSALGEGNAAALFPLLTGHQELELQDARRNKFSWTSSPETKSLNQSPFIFEKLKQIGYRTAYFEDLPEDGTFQYRNNGFREQPADHYLRTFTLAMQRPEKGALSCLGDKELYKVILNKTAEFLEMDGYGFIFTMLSEISHEDNNVLRKADVEVADFLRSLKKFTEDTLIVVMTDHGVSHHISKLRWLHDSLQRKTEERLPLLAVKLPSRLMRQRPDALSVLKANGRVLTTPHDLHATLLDALDMTKNWNPYKVPGADLRRGLSLLEKIPTNRSSSEAGIEPNWCVCLSWQNVTDYKYMRAARSLIVKMNNLMEKEQVHLVCHERSLLKIDWVLKQQANKKLIQYFGSTDKDSFQDDPDGLEENYQVKITTQPERGVFEALMTFNEKEGKFTIKERNIQRLNPFKREPDCIIKTHPHLAKFCTCRKHPIS